MITTRHIPMVVKRQRNYMGYWKIKSYRLKQWGRSLNSLRREVRRIRLTARPRYRLDYRAIKLYYINGRGPLM